MPLLLCWLLLLLLFVLQGLHTGAYGCCLPSMPAQPPVAQEPGQVLCHVSVRVGLLAARAGAHCLNTVHRHALQTVTPMPEATNKHPFSD